VVVTPRRARCLTRLYNRASKERKFSRDRGNDIRMVSTLVLKRVPLCPLRT
jgi:hypothetical protein